MRPAASLAEGPAATSARAKDMVEGGLGDGRPLLDVVDGGWANVRDTSTPSSAAGFCRDCLRQSERGDV